MDDECVIAVVRCIQEEIDRSMVVLVGSASHFDFENVKVIALEI